MKLHLCGPDSRSFMLKALPILLIGVLFFLVSCDTRDFSDSRGSIVVISSTSGSNVDADGYGLRFDGQDRGRLAPNDTIRFDRLEPQTYVVEISGIAPQCMVHDSPQRQVQLRSRQEVTVRFDVSCASFAFNLLFESDREGSLDLYTASSSTNTLTRLTSHPLADYGAALSHDATRIAFTSRREGNLDVFTMLRVGGAPQNLTDHPADDHSPAFSPDGRWVAFVSDRSGVPAVYRIRTDGTDVRLITSDSLEKSDPVFLSDDAVIVSSTREGTRRLEIVSVVGEVLYDLTPLAMDARSPAVSPNGRLVAFSGRRFGQWDIFTIRLDDFHLTQLTDDPAVDDAPAFSRDGSRIAFASNRTGTYDVYVMNADGSDVVNVTRSLSFDYAPSFLPDDD